MPGGRGEQPLEQPQPFAVGFVEDHGVAGLALPGRKLLRFDRREQGQVVAKVIQVVDMRQHRHDQARGMTNQRGRDQREARSPDSAERGRMTGLQAGQHLGKTLLRLQARDQLGEPVRRLHNGGRIRHEV